MPCPYATALGIRGQGVHSSRILGLALNDIIATIVVAIITSYVFNISFLYSLIGWFFLGEVLHVAFSVDTAFLELIGLKPHC
jgi:hypothetical protein